MAVELEQTIMAEIGLGNNYRWFNGSGDCGYIRRDAVGNLVEVAKTHGLTISDKWLNHCKTAAQVDQFDSQQYGLTNTWIACSYAIKDAIHRDECGEDAGFPPEENWVFWSNEKREEWQSLRFQPRLFGIKENR